MKINIPNNFSYSKMEKDVMKQFIKEMNVVVKDEATIKYYIHKFAQVPESFCTRFNTVIVNQIKCFFTDCFLSRCNYEYEVVCMFMAAATFYKKTNGLDENTTLSKPTFAMVEGCITLRSPSLDEDSINCKLYIPYLHI